MREERPAAVAVTPSPSAPPPSVTLRDVAREAGVALSTASRALDPASRYVTPEVRANVVETARRLGYRPNMSARATLMGRTSTVAVLVSDIRDPHDAQLVHGAIQRANQGGLLVNITGASHGVDDEMRAIRMLRGMRPLAMVLTDANTGHADSRAGILAELQRYLDDGGRVVVAGQDHLPFDTAVVPQRAGATALVSALADLGYRRPGLLVPEVHSLGVAEWEAGVLDGADKHGLLIDYRAAARAPRTRDGGYGAARRLLSLPEASRPDVLVAATDLMALGAMSAVRDAGLRPGRDIGVAGFDDVVEADDVTPGLTSVDLALADLGATAVDLALQRPGSERRLARFEPRVVLRGSTPARRR